MTKSTKGGHSPADPQLYLYNLIRDGERPLQFYGHVLAESVSPSGATEHRAAVYQTRGGQFVSEFSTRVIRTNAKPSREDLETLRSDFYDRVSDAAEWRQQKAHEFPNDTRNASSADALLAVAASVEQLPLEAPQLTALWDFYERTAGDVSATEGELEYFRGFGFHGPESNDASKFIEDMLSQFVDDVAPTVSGKVAVFASLGEALNWFRPGKLTSALLKKLGRLAPEFIE